MKFITGIWPVLIKHSATTLTCATLGAFCLGYQSHAWLHRSDMSVEQWWDYQAEMARKLDHPPVSYSILKAECETARDAYIEERKFALMMLSQNARQRYRYDISDHDYLKRELACGASP